MAPLPSDMHPPFSEVGSDHHTGPDHIDWDDRDDPPPSTPMQNPDDLMQGRRRDDLPLIRAVRMHSRDGTKVGPLLLANVSVDTRDKVWPREELARLPGNTCVWAHRYRSSLLRGVSAARQHAPHACVQVDGP